MHFECRALRWVLSCEGKYGVPELHRWCLGRIPPISCPLDHCLQTGNTSKGASDRAKCPYLQLLMLGRATVRKRGEKSTTVVPLKSRTDCGCTDHTITTDFWFVRWNVNTSRQLNFCLIASFRLQQLSKMPDLLLFYSLILSKLVLWWINAFNSFIFNLQDCNKQTASTGL